METNNTNHEGQSLVSNLVSAVAWHNTIKHNIESIKHDEIAFKLHLKFHRYRCGSGCMFSNSSNMHRYSYARIRFIAHIQIQIFLFKLRRTTKQIRRLNKWMQKKKKSFARQREKPTVK